MEGRSVDEILNFIVPIAYWSCSMEKRRMAAHSILELTKEKKNHFKLLKDIPLGSIFMFLNNRNSNNDYYTKKDSIESLTNLLYSKRVQEWLLLSFDGLESLKYLFELNNLEMQRIVLKLFNMLCESEDCIKFIISQRMVGNFPNYIHVSDDDCSKHLINIMKYLSEYKETHELLCTKKVLNWLITSIQGNETNDKVLLIFQVLFNFSTTNSCLEIFSGISIVPFLFQFYKFDYTSLAIVHSVLKLLLSLSHNNKIKNEIIPFLPLLFSVLYHDYPIQKINIIECPTFIKDPPKSKFKRNMKYSVYIQKETPRIKIAKSTIYTVASMIIDILNILINLATKNDIKDILVLKEWLKPILSPEFTYGARPKIHVKLSTLLFILTVNDNYPCNRHYYLVKWNYLNFLKTSLFSNNTIILENSVYSLVNLIKSPAIHSNIIESKIYTPIVSLHLHPNENIRYNCMFILSTLILSDSKKFFIKEVLYVVIQNILSPISERIEIESLKCLSTLSRYEAVQSYIEHTMIPTYLIRLKRQGMSFEKFILIKSISCNISLYLFVINTQRLIRGFLVRRKMKKVKLFSNSMNLDK